MEVNCKHKSFFEFFSARFLSEKSRKGLLFDKNGLLEKVFLLPWEKNNQTITFFLEILIEEQRWTELSSLFDYAFVNDSNFLEALFILQKLHFDTLFQEQSSFNNDIVGIDVLIKSHIKNIDIVNFLKNTKRLPLTAKNTETVYTKALVERLYNY